MKNTYIEHANGLIEVLWERYFEFPKRMRQFNSHMYLNPQTGKYFEYLGDPGIIRSELTFHVTNEGFLMIRTKNTNAKLFDVKIPLPNLTEVDVMGEEMYDEKLGQYRIIVYISHSIIGRIVYYKGYFNLKND